MSVTGTPPGRTEVSRDGFCCGPNGHIYFTVTQLHRAPPFNGGDEESYTPFKLFRFESLAPVTVGR